MKLSKILAVTIASLFTAHAMAAYPVRFSTGQDDASFGPASALSQLRVLRAKEGKKDSDEQLRTLPIDLTVSTGQGEIKADVRGLNISTLKVNGDQGNITLQLPEAGAIKGSVHIGQSAIQIVLPKTRAVGVNVVKTGQADLVYGNVSRDQGVPTDLTVEADQGELYFTDRVLNENQLDELLDAQQGD